MLAKMKAKMAETDNAMDLNVDDDLLELEEEVFGKKKSKKKKKKKNDDSIDLSDLEDEDLEIEEKPKKKERINKKELELDDDLAALEKEGLDDVEDDDSENEQKQEVKKEEKKEVKKEEKKVIKKEEKKEVKKEEKKEVKKEEKKEVKKEEKKVIKKEEKEEEKNDKYQEKTEKIYHSIDKMKCISVLQNEIELCDQIIKYKIDNKFDDEDIWENKKALVKVRFNNYSTFVQEGSISMEDYFKIINEELIYDKNLLSLIGKDKGLKDFEIPELKNRINKRIELINFEIEQLKQSMGGENEETKTEETKTEEAKTEETKTEEAKKEEVKKEEKKEEVKKEEVKKEEKKEEEKKEEEEENSEYSKEELESLKLVTKRIEQYKLGINYAKENEFQYVDLIKELKKLDDAKKLIESHNLKDVDMKKIPSAINPDIVFGYSTKERIIKYKELFEGLFKERTELRYELDLKIEESKKMPKQKFKKEQGKIKEILNKKKALITKCDEDLKAVKANLQDNWTPVPLYIKEEKSEKVEKINTHIQPNQIKIFIGKLLEYKHSKNVNFIELKIDLKKELKATIEENKEKNFDKSITFDIDKTEYKTLYSKELTIEMKSKGFFKNHVEETIKIKLAKLKNDIIIEDEYKLSNNSKTARLEVKIEIRNPCVGQVFEEKIKTHYHIKKMLPSFKIFLLEHLNKNKKGDNEKEKKIVNEKPKEIIKEVKKPESQNIQKPKNNPPQTQKPIEKKVENKQTENKVSEDNSEIEKIKKMPEINKSKFKPEELNDPDIIDNLVSVSILEYKDKELEEKIKKIESRIPRPLREKSNRIKVKLQFLKNALGDTITPQGYVNIMKSQLQHDKLLYYYFIQQNENDKANIVKQRIKILSNELNETEKYIKQGG